MTTEIMLYGDIGDTYWSYGISEGDVLNGLKELDPSANQHDVRINSPGGDVATGLGIMNLLRSHSAQMKTFNPNFKLATIVDGYAMSVASVIMMAGDIRKIALGGIVMIHDAWCYAAGNATELRQAADRMEKLSVNAANIYATAVGAKEKDAEYFRGLMTAETYFIGDEAVKAGLATECEQEQAQLFAELSPEKLKGHYAEVMVKTAKMRTYKRPLTAKALSDRQEAAKRLELLSATLS